MRAPNSSRETWVASLGDVGRPACADFSGRRTSSQPEALRTVTLGLRWRLPSVIMCQAVEIHRLSAFASWVTDILYPEFGLDLATRGTLAADRPSQVKRTRILSDQAAALGFEAGRHRRFESWNRLSQAIRTTLRTLRRERPIEHNWEVQLLGDCGEQDLREWLLRTGLRLRDLMPRREIEVLLEQFRAPARDQTLGCPVWIPPVLSG